MAVLLTTSAVAAAQPAEPASSPAPAPDAPAALVPPEKGEPAKGEGEGKGGDDVHKQVEELQKAVDDLQAKVDAAGTESSWTDKFRIYGFTDVGLNRIWGDAHAPASSLVNSMNATSFVIGNLDVYLDAQPVKGWRSLVEVRFTNAPHGEIQSLGGLAGTFKRTSTQQTDPNASSVAMQMWGAYTVIERAHLDWTDIPWFKVRVGNFFTPFGIWNVDHGTPTLIATQVPEYIMLRQMPLRQTGIQVFGNTFSGDWELGYAATVSNGRQELSNFAFDDNRGFGGRLYANNEKGEVSMKFGMSYYTGRVRDQEIDLKSVNPMRFATTSTFEYREHVGGLDASFDVGRTRVRLEGVLSHTRYEDGKHQLNRSGDAFLPNYISTSGYALVAHQLHGVPIEPFATFGVLHTPSIGIGGDTNLDPSAGVNVRFNKSVLWKNQVSHAFWLDARGRGNAHDIALNNATTLFSRLVLVF